MDDPRQTDDSADVDATPESVTPAQPALKTSPWVWVSLAISVVAILSALSFPLLAILGLMALDGLDGGDPLDDEYYVDQSSVVHAVEEPCEAMLAAATQIDLNGSNASRAASLHRWTKSVQGVVTAIDGAHPNDDSKAWRDDWKATIVAVDTYASHLGEPKNQLTLPDAAEDMYWATDADCAVPISIAALDPAYSDRMLGE